MSKEKDREKKLLQIMIYKDTHPDLYDYFSQLPRGESAIRARDMMRFALNSGFGPVLNTNTGQEVDRKESRTYSNSKSKLRAINPE